MAKRFPGKRLIWLLPLVIAAGLLLAVLVAALAIRLAGWHWQGPGWRDGLTLDAVWQETDGCRPLEARGVRLSALRPLTLGIDTLGIHACPDDADTASDGLTDIPSLPALEVTVWAVQYRDLPPVMVNLSQRDGAWRARAEFRDSRLRVPPQQRPLAAGRHPARRPSGPAPGRRGAGPGRRPVVARGLDRPGTLHR